MSRRPSRSPISGSTRGCSAPEGNGAGELSSMASVSGPKFGAAMPICARMTAEVYPSFHPASRSPSASRNAVTWSWTRYASAKLSETSSESSTSSVWPIRRARRSAPAAATASTVPPPSTPCRQLTPHHPAVPVIVCH